MKAEFGTKLNLPKSESRYIKLRAKGDTIKFRLAGTPTYQTDHWVEREKFPCEKYNSEDNSADCKYCEQYALAVADGNKKAADSIKPVTTFKYPILDRESGRAAVFEFTAKSIHYGIDGYAKMGVDVFACDWGVTRNEEQGNYYSVMRLDKGVLSAEDKAQLKIASEFKLEGKQSESVNPEEVPV